MLQKNNDSLKLGGLRDGGGTASDLVLAGGEKIFIIPSNLFSSISRVQAHLKYGSYGPSRAS